MWKENRKVIRTRRERVCERNKRRGERERERERESE